MVHSQAWTGVVDHGIGICSDICPAWVAPLVEHRLQVCLDGGNITWTTITTTTVSSTPVHNTRRLPSFTARVLCVGVMSAPTCLIIGQLLTAMAAVWFGLGQAEAQVGSKHSYPV